MGLSHDRAPTPTPAPELCPATPGREAPNARATEFPAAQDDARLAAEAILSSNPLAGFFYEPLVTDPVSGTRDALFTAFVNDWTGFSALLTTIDSAANAERALTADPERGGLLNDLRNGITLGKRAYRETPTDWELDVLLGLCDPSTAPLTAEFITRAYDAEREQIGGRLRERAGEDPALVDGATRVMALLAGPDTCAIGDEAGNATGSLLDQGVNSFVDGHAGIVDDLVAPAADVPLLGTGAQLWATSAKSNVQCVGGQVKGLGDLVGGIANMARHPIDTAEGLLNLAEHVPGSPLKLLHKLTDLATGAPTDTLFTNELAEDLDFGAQLLLAAAQPARDAIARGKPAEAAGRAAFDFGSLFVGLGELRAIGTDSRLAKMLSMKGANLTKAGSVEGRAASSGKYGLSKSAETLRGTKEAAHASVAEEAGKYGLSKSAETLRGTKEAAHASVAAEATSAVAKKVPLRALSAEDFEARVAAIVKHPLLSGDMKQLDKVLADARRGESGPIGELAAVERWLGEGKTVEVLTEVQQKGLKNPDYRVAGRLTEVKTRVIPLTPNYVKDEIRAANSQIKKSKHGEAGQVEIQLDGDAEIADFAALEAQVRAQFHIGCSRSLEKVTILQDGVRLGEWVRGSDGAVTRTFPPNGANP